MKFAIPCADGQLCMHFGHCQVFSIIDVDESGTITASENVTPPPHEPGLLPRWLGEKNVTHIIAGGMGIRAQNLFSENKIEVVVGASASEPQELVKSYLAGSLTTGANACDH